MVVLTVSHVQPLDILPRLIIWGVLHVFELVSNVRGPCYVFLADIDNFTLVWSVNSLKLESIIEKTLGYKSARNGRGFITEAGFLINRFLLIIPEVTHFDDGVAVTKLIDLYIVAVQLVTIP